MERTFSPKVSHKLPADVDVPSLLLTAEKVMRDLIPPNPEWRMRVSASLIEHSTIRGDDLRALLIELRDGQENARSLHLEYQKGYSQVRMRVDVWRWSRESELEIAVTSKDEAEAKGRLAVLSERLQRWLSNPVHVPLDASSAVSAPVPVAPAIPAPAAPEPNPPVASTPATPPDRGSWFSRHGREVMIGLIITIIGTVIAALIINWAGIGGQ